jgi:4-hydroxy-tetrahydrodipicolinate reductase
VHVVCGTTGIDDADKAHLAEQFSPESGVNCVLAANFAISAVLAMRLAELAAPFFDGVEIIELHHNLKVDAPSGTSIETAKRIAAARAATSEDAFSPDPTTKFSYEGARGAEVAPGVRVHAVRLPGLVAHEEILFGALGQSLSIRQDSYDRTSFVPGVLLAISRVSQLSGLTIGLDALIGI